MAVWERYGERIVSILAEWDSAEEAIKLAEQVNQKVVFPSIKELRYAGRRLVEALSLINSEGPDDEISALFNDAQFNCLRARHDAIDVATAKIALDLETALKKLGPKAILETFPKFSELNGALVQVREKIVESRRDRENREAIYAVIESGDFKSIVFLYREFSASEPVMIRMVRRDRLRQLISYGLGIAGVVVGIIAIFS